MTKGIFIESILLNINGGALTDESAVHRVDIESYIPMAVNYVMTAGRNTHLAQDGDRDIPSLFYGSFEGLTIDKTTTPRITYPKGFVPLYGNEGIRYVTDNCGNTYSPLSDSDMHTIKHYKDKFLGLGFYRPKQNYIELYLANPLVEEVNLEGIVRVEDLDDTDELPITAGFETMAIDLCIAWFTGQKKMPNDKLNNKADLNTQPNV